MALVRVRDQDVDVDVSGELEQFDWVRPRWESDKLLAASPFRYDRTPSFFVRLEPYGDLPAGVWSDSGAYDSEWASGNFAKLLAFLRNETYEEAEDYLLATYNFAETASELVMKPVQLRLERNRQALKESILAEYDAEASDYLLGRGIPAEVQQAAGVLYCAKQRAVVLPWRGITGKLANVKYRKTHGKAFWYAKGAEPIRNLVYGIERAATRTVLCEAEIDALSWTAAGFPAVAIGGVAFNKKKRDLIIRSRIEELVIATDNDKAGEKLRQEVAQELRGYVRVRQAYVVRDCKDANEALVKYGAESLRESVEVADLVTVKYVNLRSDCRSKAASFNVDHT